MFRSFVMATSAIDALAMSAITIGPTPLAISRS
jgi:hypothetical protein